MKFRIFAMLALIAIISGLFIANGGLNSDPGKSSQDPTSSTPPAATQGAQGMKFNGL